MATIIIFGAGQIGSAVARLMRSRVGDPARPQTLKETFLTYTVDDPLRGSSMQVWDQVSAPNVSQTIDIAECSVDTLEKMLIEAEATHVVNALPFHLNEKIAKAAAASGCAYLDFTEDDEMAAKVQKIYEPTGLTCAVKCGLAPGFINYVGHELVSQVANPDTLLICVGALPKHVNHDAEHPELGYNLSWSVDGLVNEYIRPCQVRLNGESCSIPPLSGNEVVMIGGITYEAAYTSGGIGSLVRELTNVPNVYYKTLRYPGHYEYVRDAVARANGDFSTLRTEFLAKFPFCTDDVIAVYASCSGKDANGKLVRKVFADHLNSMKHIGLSAIQATTAGGGLAVLEMILKGQLTGIVNHADVKLSAFQSTETYMSTYLFRG